MAGERAWRWRGDQLEKARLAYADESVPLKVWAARLGLPDDKYLGALARKHGWPRREHSTSRWLLNENLLGELRIAYCTWRLPLRRLAERFKTSERYIRTLAKRHGWTRTDELVRARGAACIVVQPSDVGSP